MHKQILKIQRCKLKDVTLGFVELGGFECVSLELPWLDNKQNVSCIPPGIYECKKIISPSNGRCFEVLNVYGRTYIQGHVGNFTRNVKGCIAFGNGIKDIDNDGVWDVTNSGVTFSALMARLHNVFILEIGL